MPSHNTETLLKFLTKQLDLSVEDLFELREAIDGHLCQRVGVTVHTRAHRTLYLPTDSMRDLDRG